MVRGRFFYNIYNYFPFYTPDNVYIYIPTA